MTKFKPVAVLIIVVLALSFFASAVDATSISTYFVSSATTISAGQNVTLTWYPTPSQYSDTVCKETPVFDPADNSVSGGASYTFAPPVGIDTYKISCGASSATVTINVSSSAAPVINSFTASPSSVANGSSSTLNWSTSNTSACTLNGVSVGTSGPSTVYPSTPPTTYTLNCQNSAGAHTTATQSVNVISTTLNVTANPVSLGNSANIQWSGGSGATSCTGTNFSTGNAPSGNVNVYPSSATTYTVNCTDGIASQSQSVTENVSSPAPLGASCSVNTTTANVGQNVTWSANAWGGTSPYSFTWSGSNIAGNTGQNQTTSYAYPGTVTASVSATDSGAGSGNAGGESYAGDNTQCTGTATGYSRGDGDLEGVNNASLLIQNDNNDAFQDPTSPAYTNGQLYCVDTRYNPPVGCNSNSNMCGGNSVTKVYLGTGTGPAGTSGFFKGATTYIAGTGPTAKQTVSAMCSNSVTVSAVADSLSANPVSYTQPGSSTLSYTSSRATSCSIDNGVGSVTPNTTSTVIVNPTPGVTTTYTLTCQGPGGPVTSQAQVTVTASLPNLTASKPSDVTATIYQPITLTGTINNTGTGSASNFPNVIQICDYGCLGINNTTAITSTISSLGSNNSTTFSGTYTPTVPSSSDQLYYRVCANTGSYSTYNPPFTSPPSNAASISETTTTDNCSDSSGGWSNLNVNALNIYANPTSNAPVTATQNQPITLSNTISNNGTANAGAFTNIVQVCDNNCQTINTVFAASNTSSLAINNSTTLTASYTPTLATTPLFYRFCGNETPNGSASFTPDIAEYNTGDNCNNWSAMTVNPPPPSLAPIGLSPLTPVGGTPITFTGTIQNSSSVWSGNFASQLYLCATTDSACIATANSDVAAAEALRSFSPKFDRLFALFSPHVYASGLSPVYMSTIDIPNNSTGNNTSVSPTATFTFPSGGGTWQYIMCADVPYVVAVASKSTLCNHWIGFTVSPAPSVDLRANNPTTRVNAYAGTPVTLTDTATNFGNAAATGGFWNVLQLCSQADSVSRGTTAGDCTNVSAQTKLQTYYNGNVAANGTSGNFPSVSYTPPTNSPYGGTGNYTLYYRWCANQNSSWVGTINQSSWANVCSTQWGQVTVISPGVSCTANPNSSYPGQQTTFIASPSVGFSPNSYVWSGGGTPSAQTSGSNIFATTYYSTGNYQPLVTASDGMGGVVSNQSCQTAVVQSPTLTLSASPTRVAKNYNGTISLTSNPTGLLYSNYSCSISNSTSGYTVSGSPSVSIQSVVQDNLAANGHSITNQTTYTETCTDTKGGPTVTATTLVNIAPSFQNF